MGNEYSTFNLKKALAGDPVSTRDGRKIVRIIDVPEASEVDAKVVTVDERGRLMTHQQDGQYSPYQRGPNDLFMALKEKTLFINVYRERDGCYRSYAHESEDGSRAGKGNAGRDFLGTFPVVIVEG